MDQIRQMTGVCPQHDILFDNLTPREHLEFFAAVKVFFASYCTEVNEKSAVICSLDLFDCMI